jgi:GxxExxY protein
MLNPELKLNEKIFENPEYKAIRDGFGDGLLKIEDENIVVLTCDVKESTRVHKFSEKFPDRFFECGISEQNMAVIASGLADSGKIPFISAYSVFSPGRNWEQIRTMIAYNNSNVKIAGHHSGIVTGEDGVTHHATEDIGIMRALPNIKIISPCDYYEAVKATIESAKIKGPVYLRLSRPETPIITTEDTPFRFGKIEKFWLPRINADTTQINADEYDKNDLLYKDLTYKIRGCIFRVDNKVGKGHKELIYKNALEEEFKKEKIEYKKEPIIKIEYENKIIGIYRPDFLIEDKIILEIKAKRSLTKEDEFQAFSYLRATKYKLLLLVNFGFEKLEIKRIINEKNNYPRQSVLNQRSSVVAIFATGHLVYQALLAAKELEEERIYTYVLNVHTIKPLDIETILEVANNVDGIVTVEDHQIAGGMGSAISEILVQPQINADFNADKRGLNKTADERGYNADEHGSNNTRINADNENNELDNYPCQSVLNQRSSVVFIGLKDTFAESGNWEDLIKKYRLDKEAIKEAVKKLLRDS